MEVSYKHLKRMTDNTGIIQFANKERPLKESGYTVDDNARALLVAINMSEKEATPPAAVYLKFLYCSKERRRLYKPEDRRQFPAYHRLGGQHRTGLYGLLFFA